MTPDERRQWDLWLQDLLADLHVPGRGRRRRRSAREIASSAFAFAVCLGALWVCYHAGHVNGLAEGFMECHGRAPITPGWEVTWKR